MLLPTIVISSEEKAAGQIAANTLAEAHRLFNVNGVLVIKHVFDAYLVNTMHVAFIERYKQYVVNKKHRDALTVGDKRFMLTLTFETPFNTPLLYANPFVAPIINSFLGDQYILGSFGAVISLPGSEAQHVHRDFPGLFTATGVDAILPPFAITMVVPLIEANETTGTTLVRPGSHRMYPLKYPETELKWPILSLGDCLLMDYRLVHGGAANQSNQVRPILYNVYSCPWFRDHVNYKKQRRLRISGEALSQIPKQHRHLFAHVASSEADFNPDW